MMGNGPEGLFVATDGLPEGLQQSLRVAGAGDDPGVKVRLVALGIELAEVEHELKGVVADIEIVSVSPFELAGGTLLLQAVRISQRLEICPVDSDRILAFEVRGLA